MKSRRKPSYQTLRAEKFGGSLLLNLSGHFTVSSVNENLKSFKQYVYLIINDSRALKSFMHNENSYFFKPPTSFNLSKQAAAKANNPLID